MTYLCLNRILRSHTNSAAKLTPILNPPISWAANVSAKKATTVLQNSVSDPLIDTKSPSYSGYDPKHIINLVFTLYNLVTSLMNGSKISLNP